MSTKKDPKDVADQLISDVDYIHTLLGAAEDKVNFYLGNRNLLGPQGELLYSCARELENLLVLMERFLERVDGELESATDWLYEIDPLRAVTSAS